MPHVRANSPKQALALSFLYKARQRIGRRGVPAILEDLPDRAPMITAMIQQMDQHLSARHLARTTVRESKLDDFGMFDGVQPGAVVNEPIVDLGYGCIQLCKHRRVRSIRRLKIMRRTFQVSSENLIYDMGMVQYADREANRNFALLAHQLRQLIEQLPIGPLLILEEFYDSRR